MLEKINRLRELSDQMFTEGSAIEKVRNSKEYQELANEIQDLLDKQHAMLPDKVASLEYAELKLEMIKEMKVSNKYDYEGIIAKFTEKKEVNQNKVLEVIGGDFGIFQELATISQVKLKDFAKTQVGLQKPLMNCIEIVSKQIKDIELITK